MPIQKWSERILMVELGDEPQFSEELQAIADRLEHGPAMHVVLNLGAVRHMNSAQIGAILRLRSALIMRDRQLRLCAIPDMIWGVMLMTGLEKVFQFSPDVPSALASLQLEQSA